MSFQVVHTHGEGMGNFSEMFLCFDVDCIFLVATSLNRVNAWRQDHHLLLVACFVVRVHVI